MGHMVNKDKEHYQNLQKRLDTHLMGAPDSPLFLKILSLMYTPEEALITSHVTMNFLSLEELSKHVGIPMDELDGQMTEMAKKGLVCDIYKGDQRFFTLPPVLGGLFEFVFMRTRDDLPMKELARLYDEYMLQNEEFIRANFDSNTNMGRNMVREEALKPEDFVLIMDWERTTKVIESATAVSVNYCSCRHKQLHLGQACDNPLEVCFTLGNSAVANIRNGFSKEISKKDALRLIRECKDLGLVQTADHIQTDISFLCNCCSCCCSFYRAGRTFNMTRPIISSNWIAEMDYTKCKGCGDCVKACPSKAIYMLSETEYEEKKHWVELDSEMCLGCGACVTTCKNNGITLKHREERVYVPETIFDRAVAMAINRGKLAEIIFEDPKDLSYTGLKRVIHYIEHSSPYKALMAIKPLRSVFLNTLVKIGKKMAPDVE